ASTCSGAIGCRGPARSCCCWVACRRWSWLDCDPRVCRPLATSSPCPKNRTQMESPERVETSATVGPACRAGPGSTWQAWRRPLLRIGLMMVCGYGGIILVLLFLENKLVYYPTPASADWQPPPSPEVQDIHLTTADDTAIHAWWWPVRG